MKVVAAAPLIRVEVDGAQLDDRQASRLTRVVVQQRLSLPTLCELTFVQPGGPFESASGLSWGKSVQLRAGEPGRVLFSGEITAFEYSTDPDLGRLLRIRCYDVLHRLRKRRPQRVHVETTLAELARELTSELGISVDASGTSPLWARLIQHSQSDLQLLHLTSQRSGAYFWLDGDTLRLFRLSDAADTVTLRYGQDLHEAALELNADESVAQVRSQGWNPWLAEAHQAEADAPRNRSPLAIDPLDLGGECKANLTNRAFQRDDEAQAAAQGELDRRAGESVVISGVARDQFGLRPGVAVEIAGLEPSLSGRHVVCSATHQIDGRRGHRVEFSTRPPEPFGPAAGAEIGLGIVTDVDDPQALGRVKVELASCGRLESDWLQVLSPGAGEGKGLVMVPDVGDHVMVLFVGGDAAQGIVLGGLYGPGGTPDAGVDEGRIKRFLLRSADGQLLRFNDTEGTVRLENHQGSFLELTPEKIVLHAEGDLEIEAPGKTLILRASNVDFQQA